MLKDEKREASSKRIIEAAMHEFALRGFSGARIESMAGEAGVSKGLISQRFGTKDALYGKVYDECFVERYHNLIPGDSDLLSFLKHVVKIIKEAAEKEPLHFSFICSFFNDSDVPLPSREKSEIWFRNSGISELMTEEMKNGTLQKQDPYVAFFFFLRISCDITRCFTEANLALPEDENYLNLAGFQVEGGFIDKNKQRRMEVISMLSADYDAVYYVDAVTGIFEVLYQNNRVRTELGYMLKTLSKFSAAYTEYVKNFVHPEDQAMLLTALEKLPERLKKHKNFRIDFRRNINGHYEYREFNCVKVGDEEELKAFVVGFAENDALYRTLLDQKKQLETAVTERTYELQTKNRTLNKINEDIVELLGNITEARDTESGQHIRRVKGFTHILAEQVRKDWPEYGLTEDTVELITAASPLHDVGKIGIPDAILLKPGKLTKEEFEIMKTHCEKGCDILKHAPKDWSDSYLRTSMDICHFHHEKYDGKGYPLGLKGDEIPISAQIVSVVDCFDALSTKRVYKEAYELSEAFEMILRGECGAFSDKLLSSFRCCKEELFKHAFDEESAYYSSLPMGIGTESLSKIRLLFAEEDDVKREMTQNLLRAEGAEVTAVVNGREAIETFQNVQSGYFDAVLLSMDLPEISGIEVSKMIRALDRPDAKSVSLIALTDLPLANEVTRWLDAGIDSCITKPVAIATLNRVLYECMESHSEALGNAVLKADRDANEKLERVVHESSLFSGFLSDYDLLCYVNINTEDVSSCRVSGSLKRIFDSVSRRLPSNRRFDRFLRSIIPQRRIQEFLKNNSAEFITEYLKTHESYHQFVPAFIDGKDCIYRLRAVKDPEEPGCYVFGLQSVDAETEEEIRTYEMIRIFSDSYQIVDYVDFVNDSYARYRDNGIIPDTKRSHYFAELVPEYINTYIDPEDREMLLRNLTPENIKMELLLHPRLTYRFKDISSGTPVYEEIQIIRAGENEGGFHALMMISDIDQQMKNEAEQNARMRAAVRQLKEAERYSVRDELTGVKDITAYTDSVTALSETLQESPKQEFGIVVCDIDNLKEVNNRYAHSTGDIFIKNCCKIICNTFKHSPVFRIGGDEFAVILQGVDYSNRDALMKSLRDAEAEAFRLPSIEKGKAAFSSGLGIYDPIHDETIAEVMQRADIAMFSVKKMKNR